jgi:hypothetical protein
LQIFLSDNATAKLSSSALEYILISHFHALQQRVQNRRVLCTNATAATTTSATFASVLRVAEAAEKHRQENPKLYHGVFSTLFEAVIGTDSQNMWIFARPFFVLILLEQQLFSEYKAKAVQSQKSQELKNKLELGFSDLMKDILPSIDSKNLEKVNFLNFSGINSFILLVYS